MEDDFAVLGIASDEARTWAGLDQVSEDFGVWPENWLTVRAFMALATQWHWTGGMEPRRAGLIYASLPTIWEEFEVQKKKRPEIIRGLRMMELAALEVMTAG